MQQQAELGIFRSLQDLTVAGAEHHADNQGQLAQDIDNVTQANTVETETDTSWGNNPDPWGAPEHDTPWGSETDPWVAPQNDAW